MVMVQRMLFVGLAAVLVCAGFGYSMEKGFSWSYAPAQGDNVQAQLAAYQLSKYLEECQVNRPEILAEVKSSLDDGKYYRQRTRDQKNKGTLLTVYVDRDYILHIVTYRNEQCPDCQGTGTRVKPFENIANRVAVRLRCLKCDGKGEIENFTNERYFTLSSEDFEHPEEMRALFKNRAYSNAPQGTEMWVERLASDNPKERMEACLWLDKNYVREGVFFQDIMPMLKKARLYEANEKRKLLVWQFWAGKDLPNERKRYYYRIYADSKTGKVNRKGFYAK